MHNIQTKGRWSKDEQALIEKAGLRIGWRMLEPSPGVVPFYRCTVARFAILGRAQMLITMDAEVLAALDEALEKTP